MIQKTEISVKLRCCLWAHKLRRLQTELLLQEMSRLLSVRQFFTSLDNRKEQSARHMYLFIPTERHFQSEKTRTPDGSTVAVLHYAIFR
jgi:hypothetical protein